MIFSGVNIERKVPCTMRDGTILYADIYRPAKEGEYPVLLMRQPYGRALASTVTYAHPVWFARHGYMVIIQDVRGRGESEGTFTPFVQEVEDGYDTVEWAAALPNSNGKIGMYGFSYQGITQWTAAAARPPHLKAIAPGMAAADLYNGVFYPHGRFGIGSFLPWAFQLARDTARREGDGEAEAYCTQVMKNPDLHLWDLPLNKEHPILSKYFPTYYEWCDHTTYDQYWKERDWLQQITQHQIPAFHIGGWFDNYLNGTLQTFEALQASKKQSTCFHRLIIGPWVHIPWGRMTGGTDYGPYADGDIQLEHLKWFNYWLKGEEEGYEQEPAVKYYELESESWRCSDALPLLEMKENSVKSRWYLTGGPKPANGASGGGRLVEKPQENNDNQETDVYVYDARLPMVCQSYLPMDRSSQQDRYEILNYTSEPLEQSLRIAGSPKVKLYCQVLDGPTDVVATLSMVKEDGSAKFLSLGREELVCDTSEEEVDWACLEFSLRPFAVELKAGAALRLEITSSAFPLFVRHPNGCASENIISAKPEDLKMATIAVAHSKRFPSLIDLPIVE